MLFKNIIGLFAIIGMLVGAGAVAGTLDLMSMYAGLGLGVFSLAVFVGCISS